MANAPAKFRLPKIQTPWEPVANRELEIVLENLNDALRDLEADKLEGADFSVSGSTHGDILVADENLVYRPAKVVPFTFGVGTNLSVTGTLTVTGNVSLGGTLSVTGAATVTGDVTLHARLIVSGAPAASATLPKFQLGNPLVGGDADGTFFGINAASGFAGDFGHFQVNGTTVIKLGWNTGGTAAGELSLHGDFPSIYFRSGAGVLAGRIASNGIAGDISFNVERLFDLAYLQTLQPSFRHATFDGVTRIGVPIPDSVGQLTISNTYTANPVLSLIAHATQSVNGLNYLASDTTTVLASVSNIGAGLFRPLDTATSAVTVALTLGHSVTGTPAAGFGTELRFQLKSSTTADRNAAGITVEWVTATEGSQAAKGRAYAYYTSTARECFQWEADSSAAKFAVLGATAAAQQTGGAATAGAAYTATEQAMLQAAYDCLRTFGFLT